MISSTVITLYDTGEANVEADWTYSNPLTHCGLYRHINEHEMLKITTLDVSLKITNLRLHLHLPGTKELIASHAHILDLDLVIIVIQG